MAATPAAARHRFTADLNSALQVAANSTTPKTRRSRTGYFKAWMEFCRDLNLPDATLSTVRDDETALGLLLVFAIRYRRHGRSHKPVRATTVDKALSAVAKGITDLGHPDPRDIYINGHSAGRHPLLSDFLKALRDEDSPANRAHPANTTILRGLQAALNASEPRFAWQHATVRDLTIVGFYWLLRPGEYLYSTDADSKRSTPFLLKDVHFTIAGVVYPAMTAPLNDVNSVDRIQFATLTFTD